jgi:exopolysaccharide biosynthesis protein
MAAIMLDLGAVDALNLDGGGSSTMVIEGQVVNKPSDDRERELTNAILVLPGRDPGED